MKADGSRSKHELAGLLKQSGEMASSDQVAARYGTVEMSDHAAVAPLVGGAPLGGRKPSRPRLIPRRRGPRLCAQGQSTRERTVRFTGEACGACCLALADPIHILLSMHTAALTLLVVALYVVLIAGFVPVYLSVTEKCDMQLNSPLEAYYFSLITISTIGYGSHNNDFAGCWEAGAGITAQWILGAIANACCLALVFMRITRVSRRESTVVFSDKAVLRKIGGSYYFSFQVVDVSPYVLTEAHVRMYAVNNMPSVDGISPKWVQHSAMRIDQPDDERGATLFLELPTAVVHRLDAWSPLVPPHRAGAAPRDGSAPHDPRAQYRFPDVLQRATDAENGSRTLAMCEVCGETYESAEALMLHQMSSCVDDRVSGHDVTTIDAATGEAFASAELAARAARAARGALEQARGDALEQAAHSACNHAVCEQSALDAASGGLDAARRSAAKLPSPLAEARRNVRALRDAAGRLPPSVERLLQRGAVDTSAIVEWLSTSGAEIVVVVEGIEPVTSATGAARHSYSWEHGDIAVHHSFVPCVSLFTVTFYANHAHNLTRSP